MRDTIIDWWDERSIKDKYLSSYLIVAGTIIAALLGTLVLSVLAVFLLVGFFASIPVLCMEGFIRILRWRRNASERRMKKVLRDTLATPSYTGYPYIGKLHPGGKAAVVALSFALGSLVGFTMGRRKNATQ